MFWDRRTAGLVAALAAAGALAVPHAAKAGIVVASSGPSAGQYPAGRKLDDAARISLKAGDSVTILDSRGTRVLRGPTTVTVGSTGGPSRTSTFAALTRQRSAQRVRTGAVRGGTTGQGKVMNPNLWYLDPAHAGTMCLLDSAALQVWRPDAKTAASYAVASAEGTARSSVAFASGEMIGAWDTARSPIADGARYTIQEPGEATSRQVTFVVLPARPTTPEDLAAALIEKGCAAQLELLSETLANSAR